MDEDRAKLVHKFAHFAETDERAILSRSIPWGNKPGLWISQPGKCWISQAPQAHFGTPREDPLRMTTRTIWSIVCPRSKRRAAYGWLGDRVFALDHRCLHRCAQRRKAMRQMGACVAMVLVLSTANAAAQTENEATSNSKFPDYPLTLAEQGNSSSI